MSFNIIVFLLVLGLLIFVHELGHFLAAKVCGIYVDRFSLGFPPRLFGFKWGETDYCVGLLPVGGYVKMAGQEDAPLSEDEREKTYGHVTSDRWFNSKPRYQRAFVLIAGPAMNLVLGFVVYAVMAGVGGETPLAQFDNRIGEVREDSAAAEAPLYLVGEDGSVDYTTPDAVGWKTGDRILFVNGNRVQGILQDVAIAAILSDGETIRMQVERTHPDGSQSLYMSPVRPRIPEGEDFPQFGITPYNTALVARVRPGMPAEAAGLQVGDEIIRANGQWVDTNTFSRMVSGLAPGERVEIEVLREGKVVPLTVQTDTRGRIEGIAFRPPANPLLGADENTIVTIDRKDATYSRETGLRPGDRIIGVEHEDGEVVALPLLVNLDPRTPLLVTAQGSSRLWGLLGQPSPREVVVTVAELLEGITGFPPDAHPQVAFVEPHIAEATGLKREDELIEIDGMPATAALLRTVEETRGGETIPVTVRRPSVLYGLHQREETFQTELIVSNVQEIGVIFGVKTAFHRATPSEIVPEAWRRSVRTVGHIGVTLKLLVTNRLSPEMLGGPVMIYQITTGAARTNFVLFLDIVAMISINLAIFNLLPLPVLDGGQLMFLGIEAIRRKPVSVRVMETVQQVGLLLIIGLMVYVTFNDVGRLLTSILP